MILGFILIMLIIGTGLALSIYSMYVPFIADLGNVKFYNMAYYGAISSLERANLVLRYKVPGFEGSGGWKASVQYGPLSDYLDADFGFLTSGPNGMQWSISSMVNAIPEAGRGNVDILFADQSKDFNQLPYFFRESILLYNDNTTLANEYYLPTDPTNINRISTDSVSLQMRLNPMIYSGITELTLGNASLAQNVDVDGDRLGNDEIVTRGVVGLYDDEFFRILPTPRVTYFGTSAVMGLTDMMIREDVINARRPAGVDTNANIVFGGTQQAISAAGRLAPLQGLNVIAPRSEDIEVLNFFDIFTTNQFTELSINFSLINLLESVVGNVYPFLEYQVSLPAGVSIPGRYYTITSQGTVGNYTVSIQTLVPTVPSNTIGDFTIIF